MSDPVFYMFISFILNVVVHITMFWFFIFVISSPSMFVSGIVHVIFYLTIHSLHVHLYLKKMVHESGSLLSQMNLVRKKSPWEWQVSD